MLVNVSIQGFLLALRLGRPGIQLQRLRMGSLWSATFIWLCFSLMRIHKARTAVASIRRTDCGTGCGGITSLGENVAVSLMLVQKGEHL